MSRVVRRGRGSSPLARGLPGLGVREVGEVGIIPARAGFTPGARSSGTCRGDHPRSRGVYHLDSDSSQGLEGSSPLARGLPILQLHRALVPRIIPARAGFTRLRTPRPPSSRDHPRSRGVYLGTPVAFAAAVGSSPLARGLLAITSTPIFARSDHPRSRGVYASDLSTGDIIEGSSPLARGLHLLPPLEGRRVGIIPARAGFTAERAVDGQRPGGSSPLARGLRLGHPQPVAEAGIIPARAGFTDSDMRPG